MAVSEGDVVLAIENKLVLEFPLKPGMATIPFFLDNAPSEQINGPHVFLAVQFGKAMPTLDGFRVDRVGAIFVVIKILRDTGNILGRNISQAVTEIFQLKEFSGIFVKAATPQRIGVVNESSFYQLNLTIPFWYQDVQ